MIRHRFLTVCAIVCWAASPLAGQQDPLPPEAAGLFREIAFQLRDAPLTDSQIAQIKKLAAEFGPQIRQAERQAAASAAQRNFLAEAMAQAIQQRLRGKRVRELLAKTPQRTDEQRRAFQEATRLRRAFDQAVSSVLSETQRAEIQQPGKDKNETSGFLIVQLSPTLRLPPASSETLDAAAAALDLKDLQAVIAQYGLTQSQRAVKAELLDRLKDAGNNAAGNEIRLLRTFWQIDVRDMQRQDIDKAVQNLNNLREVEYAYAPLVLREPAGCSSVQPSDDPDSGNQGYLNAAPQGIDARAAWNVTGGQGAGVGVVDIEGGWNINHEDLKGLLDKPFYPLYGDRMLNVDHGTSVMGEIVAADNTVGIVGAAPCVDYAAISSMYDSATSYLDPHIANPLIAALFFMDPGDVLLVEYEADGGFPVEVDLLNYIAIRLAVILGMIVIEPSGNGHQDLDAFLFRGRSVLNRHSTDFRDSGAIMVGASDPRNSHIRANASTYGSRLDCFGWGTNVTTTSRHDVPDILDNGGGDDNKSYRWRFGGTSAASPIVTGAALLVQGLWKTKRGTHLTSTQMRDILSNPSTGTPQGALISGHIGVMPNLKAIIATQGLGDSPAPAPAPGVQTCPCRPYSCLLPRRLLRCVRARR